MTAHLRWISLSIVVTVVLLGSVLSAMGCSSRHSTSAPVINAWHDPKAMKSRYRVQKKDTLYSIAWAFDLDYRDLAQANHLSPPYLLKPGQTLTMCPVTVAAEELPDTPADQAVVYAAANLAPCYQELVRPNQETNVILQEPVRKTPVQEESLAAPQWQPSYDANLPEYTLRSNPPNQNRLSPPQRSGEALAPPKPLVFSESPPPVLPQEAVNEHICPRQRSGKWPWPARGQVAKGFQLQGECCNKGIDIEGQPGDPITAVASGKVVYSGSGLRGYGNLIIIKHSDNYLSAYAYNKKLLVKEGDIVRAGSLIGKMGQNNSGKTLLHFEIRRNGKPVNPLLYL